jgi:hypothetical protein
MAPTANPPRIFLSYSHDSEEHRVNVLALAHRLRDDGCIVTIDQEHLWVGEGWTVWMIKQIEQATFVLVICTEVYKRRAEGGEESPAGAGASWEGAIIRTNLYEANGRNNKFIPVVMRPEDRIHRPTFLRDYSYFVASDRDGYHNLCLTLGATVHRREETPSAWQVALPSPFFCGREDYLRTLRDAFLTNKQPVALTQTIKGLGGMGKTQTALKYAQLHRASYSSGLRVVADSSDKLVFGFAEYSRLLGLPGKDDTDVARLRPRPCGGSTPATIGC